MIPTPEGANTNCLGFQHHTCCVRYIHPLKMTASISYSFPYIFPFWVKSPITTYNLRRCVTKSMTNYIKKCFRFLYLQFYDLFCFLNWKCIRVLVFLLTRERGRSHIVPTEIKIHRGNSWADKINCSGHFAPKISLYIIRLYILSCWPKSK